MADEKWITLRPSDLELKMVQTQNGDQEVVSLKNNLAFDEVFIEECKGKGVKYRNQIRVEKELRQDDKEEAEAEADEVVEE